MPSANYDENLPTAKDRLRFKLGDIDTAAPLLYDETYTAILTLRGDDEDLALSDLAGSLITRYAQQPVRERSGTSERVYEDRLKGWQEIMSTVSTATAAATSAGGFQAITPSRGTRAMSEFGSEDI